MIRAGGEELSDDPATTTPAPKRAVPERDGIGLRVSAALWRRPWARATILLTPPLAWFILAYLAALVVLLITAFWQINPVHDQHRSRGAPG